MAVGANAVVTKDVPDNAVVGGIPEKSLILMAVKILLLYNLFLSPLLTINK